MLLDLAILNNASWCSAVVAAHGIRNTIEEHDWSADADLARDLVRCASGSARSQKFCEHRKRDVRF
ncbi:MAG: hypothetical protein ACYTEG_00310 [Planctomycetota bacterium]